MSVFKNPSTLLQEDMNSLFQKKEKGSIDILFSIVSLILLKNQRNTDMLELFKTVDIDTFVKVIHLFDGRKVQFLKDKDLSDTLVLALSYYYREVEGIKDWEEVQSYFGDYKIERLSHSLKIHGLNEFTKMKIDQLFGKENTNEESN